MEQIPPSGSDTTLPPELAPGLVRAAFHEAGHIVMGHILGCELIAATVDPDNGDGRADIGDPPDGTLRSSLLLLAAGAVGAEMSGIDMQYPNELMGDAARALNLTNETWPDDEEAGFREWSAALRQASELLEGKRKTVVHVASALLQAQGYTLTGAAISDLLGPPG